MVIERNLIPGNEWLYFKFYTGYKSADTLITNYLYPFVVELQQKQLIEEFFFIRYIDTSFHIRLRCHLKDISSCGMIFQKLNDVFNESMNNQLIYKIQVDTYKRELERYGMNLILWVESFFCIDSLYIIKLLELNIGSDFAERDRWLLALRLLDDTLNIFGYDLTQKKNLLKLMAEQFKNEFSFKGHYYKKQLDNKYRDNQKLIKAIFTSSHSPITQYKNVLDLRINELSVLVREISENNEPEKSIKDVIVSLLHMTMNRLFRSGNRLYEMVLYDFLSRYYISAEAQVPQKMDKSL